MMNHGCLVRCVLWPGNVHALGLNVLMGSRWSVTGTSNTSGSTVSGSEKTCQSRENNILRRFSGGSDNSRAHHRSQYKDHVWSYNCLTDHTEDGRPLRHLAVIDETTPECLAIEVSRSFTTQDVIGVLQYLFAVRGTPHHLRRDNGPEFVAKSVRRWLQRADVRTLFIAKGSPWEIGYVELAGGKLRDELLTRELFLSLEEARWVIDR